MLSSDATRYERGINSNKPKYALYAEVLAAVKGGGGLKIIHDRSHAKHRLIAEEWGRPGTDPSNRHNDHIVHSRKAMSRPMRQETVCHAAKNESEVR